MSNETSHVAQQFSHVVSCHASVTLVLWALCGFYLLDLKYKSPALKKLKDTQREEYGIYRNPTYFIENKTI